MHPNPKFAWRDEAAMRAFVTQNAFALITIALDGKPASAQAPLLIAPDGSVRFHLSRANPLALVLEGAPVLASVVGSQFYVSPDWYGTADQVPTWNYRMVEIEGTARRLDDQELREQIDGLSAVHETRLAPKPAWSSTKMDQARLDAMIRAIVGFGIDAPRFSGTVKMGQNRSDAEAAGAIEALRISGNMVAADEMAAAR